MFIAVNIYRGKKLKCVHINLSDIPFYNLVPE
jgi:hypothetical protein